MSVHADLWELEPALSHSEVIAYTYLNTYCHKGFPISLTIMARRIHMDTKRLRRAIDTLIERNMISQGDYEKGRPRRFMVITRRSKSWGQTPLPLGSDDPAYLGSNAPTSEGQTPLLTGNLDHIFLSLFQAQFSAWQFNKKKIGKFFVFTRAMQTRALECMRYLHKNCVGFSSPDAFNAFLTKCGEYLAHDRDVLSPAKDQRALSPGKWLQDWPEQIRLAGIYIEEQERNVVRMPSTL